MNCFCVTASSAAHFASAMARLLGHFHVHHRRSRLAIAGGSGRDLVQCRSGEGFRGAFQLLHGHFLHAFTTYRVAVLPASGQCACRLQFSRDRGDFVCGYVILYSSESAD